MKKEKWSGLRLSPTSINTYLTCPRDFYYKYVQKLPIPSSPALIKGNVVHKVLEKFFRKQYKPDLDAYMRDIFEQVWDKYKEEWKELKLPAKETKKEVKDCWNILDMYLQSFKAKINVLVESGKADNERHAFYLLRPKFKEKFLEDKELNLCGFIDRIHTDFDGITTLGDYKTGFRYGIGIKEDYDLQCGIYALLWNRCMGTNPDYTSIIFLRYGEEVRTTVTPYQVKKALDIVEYVHSKTKTDDIKDYPCSQHKLCSYSPFFNKKSGLCEFEDKKRQEKAMKALEAMKNGKTSKRKV